MDQDGRLRTLEAVLRVAARHPNLLDEEAFDELATAIALRERMALASDGVRLVHGEADGLPGLVVDRYGDILSVQFLCAGVVRW